MASMRHDTRDSPFLPTQGHVIDVSFEQVTGTYTFSREILDAQQFFLLHQRPDGSGRHTLRLSSMLGFTGSNTPIFENFFAGGYNTIRGFYFRGASPKDDGMFVGGKFQFVNTVEYMFPVTADDMLKMVTFCDFGTVEPSTEIKPKDFRVVPGIGVRIAIPAFGPAPLALDLGIPVLHAEGDRIYNFSFNMGATR
jgi:outer membrane protein insertion porin family